MPAKAIPRVPVVEDERLLCMKEMVHLCDIGNPAKPIGPSREWAERIMTEFFQQGDSERAMGLPCSPMMDRRRSNLEQGQIGFIKFVVLPIFEIFSNLIPESQKCTDIVKENLEYWKNENEQKIRRKRRERARTLPPNQLESLGISLDTLLADEELISSGSVRITIDADKRKKKKGSRKSGKGKSKRLVGSGGLSSADADDADGVEADGGDEKVTMPVTVDDFKKAIESQKKVAIISLIFEHVTDVCFPCCCCCCRVKILSGVHH